MSQPELGDGVAADRLAGERCPDLVIVAVGHTQLDHRIVDDEAAHLESGTPHAGGEAVDRLTQRQRGEAGRREYARQRVGQAATQQEDQ